MTVLCAVHWAAFRLVTDEAAWQVWYQCFLHTKRRIEEWKNSHGNA